MPQLMFNSQEDPQPKNKDPSQPPSSKTVTTLDLDIIEILLQSLLLLKREGGGAAANAPPGLQPEDITDEYIADKIDSCNCMLDTFSKQLPLEMRIEAVLCRKRVLGMYKRVVDALAAVGEGDG